MIFYDTFPQTYIAMENHHHDHHALNLTTHIILTGPWLPVRNVGQASEIFHPAGLVNEKDLRGLEKDIGTHTLPYVWPSFAGRFSETQA